MEKYVKLHLVAVLYGFWFFVFLNKENQMNIARFMYAWTLTEHLSMISTNIRVFYLYLQLNFDLSQ